MDGLSRVERFEINAGFLDSKDKASTRVQLHAVDSVRSCSVLFVVDLSKVFEALIAHSSTANYSASLPPTKQLESLARKYGIE